MLFLLPPVLNALAISRTDITFPAYRLRGAVFFSTIATATYGILCPPSHNALANYANGFFLSWYLIWSTNILFIYDIRSLRRLQVRNVHGHDFCSWQPIYETSGLRRLIWVLDLSTNFRGLGWMCTKPGASWPSAKYRWCPTTTYGLAGRLRKLAMDVLIFSAARILTRKSLNNLHVDTVSTAIALYGLMDGVHVTMSIVAAHILGPRILGTWGRSELYPPLFGRLRDLGPINLKAFWGRLWHDLLKGAMISMTDKFVSLSPGSCAEKVAMQSGLCFVLSAAVHAAATYSVSRSLPAALQVFAGFSAQIFGIMLQHGTKSAFSPSANCRRRGMVQGAGKAIEATVGIVWVLLSFPSIYMDPALQAVINSVDKLALGWTGV